MFYDMELGGNLWETLKTMQRSLYLIAKVTETYGNPIKKRMA